MDMGVTLLIVGDLLKPPAVSSGIEIAGAAVRAFGRRDASWLCTAIVPWGDAAFNAQQAPRLVQELRVIADESDEATRANIEAAIALIEGQATSRHRWFAVFLGD
jgi:hypothetical protein